MNEQDLIEEQIHLSNVVATFQQYTQYTLAANNRRRKDLYTIPREDQELLDALGYKKKLNEVDEAIDANGRFLEEIVSSPDIFMRADMNPDTSDEDDEDDAVEHRDPTGLTPGGPRPLENIHAVPTGGRVHVSGSEVHLLDAEGNVIHVAQKNNPPATTPRPSHPHSHSPSHSHSHAHPGAHSHSHSPQAPISPTAQRTKSSKAARKRYRPTDFDMDKLRSTLKQFVRDWSEDGKSERNASYEPIKEALVKHFANVSEAERHQLRVLVPGAGLGRLAYDIASMGFSCQGNEFSHYMLLSSFLILNRTQSINQYTIYPYVHSFSNVVSRATMLKSVSIPDVLPSEGLQGNAEFSLVAGDFEQVYGSEWQPERGEEPQNGHWDAVSTCFFIDTAKNIVNYLRVIHRLLAPGGVWINLGPLLWHWENNSTSDPSIELDLEEVKELARLVGFTISNERTIETTYTTNDTSMLDYTYKAAFWTATKNPDPEPSEKLAMP